MKAAGRWLALLGAALAASELAARVVGVELAGATAALVAALVEWTGELVLRDGGVLASPGGFSYWITPACVGVGPALVVGLLLAATPGPGRRRLATAALGGVALLLANLVRLVGLFHLGVAWPEHFDLFHLGFGQLWIVAAMAAVLLYWRPLDDPARSPVLEAREGSR